MTDIVKDIENVAAAGASLRTAIIIGIGAAALVGALATWTAHHFEERGRQLERAGWLAKENAARIAQEKKDAVDTLRHQQIERETSERHQKELDQLRADAAADRAAADRAGGLRIPVVACPDARPAAATETAGAGGRDEAGPASVRLPQSIENGLWALANDADEVSAQLRACQGWILANGFYGPEPAAGSELLGRIDAVENQESKGDAQ
jgi:hypothetical protein